MEEGVLQDPTFETVRVAPFLLYLFDPLLLSLCLSIGSLSDVLLEKHDNKRPHLITAPILRALSEKDRHLVALEHNIGEIEL